MTPSPEQPGDRSPSLDEVGAERLLRGQRPAPGASTDEQAVARLLAAASAPPTARELSGEARAVAAFTATRPATTGPRHARHVIRRHRPAIRPRVSHGVAAAAALGALTLGGVAAAAYTGSLPTPIQRLAHDHLGAPRNDAHPHPPSTHPAHRRPTPTALRSSRPPGDQGQPGLSAATPPPSRSRTTHASGPSPTSQRVALCNQYATERLHGDDHDADATFRKLAKLAGGRDKVFDYCAPVWRDESGGRDQNHDPQDPRYPWPTLRTAPADPYSHADSYPGERPPT